MQAKGLREIIGWADETDKAILTQDEFEVSWYELIARLKELEKEIVLHQRHYDSNGFAYRELNDILSSEVK